MFKGDNMSSSENANSFNCDRRDFLKAAGIGAAALVFPIYMTL